MITLNKQCEKHTPHTEAITEISHNFGADQYTFCEECEQNVSRFWLDEESDRLGRWSKWHLTR